MKGLDRISCECRNGIEDFTFAACDIPEHQVVMAAMKSAAEETMRRLVVKSLTELAHQILDDERVLSASTVE